MQNLRNFSLFLLLLMATLGLQAQNGNAVVSEVKLYDIGGGTGILVVRVSGNQAYQYTGGSYTATGARIVGGAASSGIGASSRVPVVAPTPGNGNGGGNSNPNGNQSVLLTAYVPLTPSSGHGPDFVTVDLSVASEGDGRVFWHWSFPVTTTNP
jgi:hypothetical protein